MEGRGTDTRHGRGLRAPVGLGGAWALVGHSWRAAQGPRRGDHKKRTRAHVNPGPKERTAATYSRASYTGTTIGNAAFDGRVRDGIGSDHCFIATEKCSRTSAPAVP